jgi:hypothetical protein
MELDWQGMCREGQDCGEVEWGGPPNQKDT